MFCCCAIIVLTVTAVAGTVGDAKQGQRLSSANTKFAVDVYKRQTSATKGNIFISPISISVALGMTYLGAKGQTKSQMKEVLHFDEVKDEHLHQALGDVQSALNNPEKKYKLLMANRLFADKSQKILGDFSAAERKYYAAEVAPVDFSGDTSGAIEVINKWVAEKTNNKISQIVSGDAVNALTKLILVNAVYFKGEWLRKFPAKSSIDRDFHVSPTESVKVKMMHAEKGVFFYGANTQLHCQAIELPYAGGTLSMFVLLPDQKTTNLSEMEKQLTASDLLNVKQKFHMSSETVDLLLPKFRLDEELSLAEMLAGMGMKDLFTDGVADLSGISESKELYVSKVFHQAVVEVNEEGTEAAAATATHLVARSMLVLPETKINFRADHPFLFFIQDKATGSILFLGRLVKPPVV